MKATFSAGQQFHPLTIVGRSMLDGCIRHAIGFFAVLAASPCLPSPPPPPTTERNIPRVVTPSTPQWRVDPNLILVGQRALRSIAVASNSSVLAVGDATDIGRRGQCVDLQQCGNQVSNLRR